MKGLKRFRAAAVVAVCALVLSACDFSVYNVPLPGGPDTGDDPMTVTVKFRDVLDLVPQSTVKVNDVTVGKVTEIGLDGYTAEVTLEMRGDVDLPDNAVAKIRQTSLLGEKFVSLEPPEEGQRSQRLQDGDVIPLDRSGRNPEVEEVLGALSLMLNGGGVAQLKTITKELNLALEGREGAARSVLRQIRSFMGQLDANKGDIVRAIENLNRLAVEIRKEQPTIDATLEELPSALDSIDRQRTDLVTMLRALNELGDVGVRVIRQSKTATIDSLELLNPVLSQLAASGDNFTKAFHVFLTYPFVDEVVGRDPQVARNLHMGDYTNLSVQLDVNTALENEGVPPLPEDACQTLADVEDTVRDELGDGPVPLDDLLGVLEGVDDACAGARKALDKCLAKDDLGRLASCLGNKLGLTITDLTQGTVDEACDLLGIPADQCPDLDGGGGGGGGGGGLPLPGVPGLPGASGGSDSGSDSGGDSGGGVLGGLNRAGYGETGSSADRGPTVGQLMDSYDPALVSLLVPGMVLQ